MNIESIADWLEAIGVPREVVSIGVEADNTWCVLRTERVERSSRRESDESAKGADTPEPGNEADGDSLVVAWEVFWREQGNRYDWASFTNEQVACHYLFGRLAWSQVVRGAVGVLNQ